MITTVFLISPARDDSLISSPGIPFSRWIPKPEYHQEFWEVRFETELGDFLSDLPSFDEATDQIYNCLSERGSVLFDKAAEPEFDYHFETGGNWGILVFRITLTGEEK